MSDGKGASRTDGCCQSTPQADEDPVVPSQSHPHGDIPSHARPASPSQLPEAPDQGRRPPSEPHSSRRGPRQRRVGLGEQFNAPLQHHIWTSKRRQWTRAELDRERRDFFDTRVTGHAEIWATLKVVVGLMADGDLATAQGIIDAAAITVPTGDLKNGVYDEAGNLYQMPEYVISDPQNVVSGSPREGEAEPAVDAMNQDELDQKRDEKGKTVLKTEDAVRVKARLSDRGGPDIIIVMGKEQAVRTLVRRIKEEANISGTVKVKIAYMGKILSDGESLLAQGWHEGHVVNGLVFQ